MYVAMSLSPCAFTKVYDCSGPSNPQKMTHSLKNNSQNEGQMSAAPQVSSCEQKWAPAATPQA